MKTDGLRAEDNGMGLAEASSDNLDPLACFTFRPVSERSRPEELFAPRRCGIYVLRFADDELYVGQTVDMGARLRSHRRAWSDIVAVAFRDEDQQRLDHEELALIRRCERAEYLLRNVVGASRSPSGPRLVDDLVDPTDQQRWLADPGFDLVGERPSSGTVSAGRGKLARLEREPHVEDTLTVLRLYAAVALPAAGLTEQLFWSCSCLPERSRHYVLHARLSIHTHEVLSLGVDRDLDVFTASFHLAESPLEGGVGHRFARRHPSVRTGDVLYFAGGTDQLQLIATGVEAAVRLLDDHRVLRAIRAHNLHTMRKGPSLNYASHSRELAERYLRS